MKRPVLITVLAFLYILSPLLNFLITLWIYDVPGFYKPQVWIEWVPRIGVLSWIFVGTLALSGLALLVKRKWSWTWAMISLVVVVALNIFLSLKGNDSGPLNHEWSAFSSLTLIVIVWSFKYPYLDRREQWLKVAYRFQANIPMAILETKKMGVMKNLSLTGALIQTAVPLPPMGLLIELAIGKKGRFHAKVVRTQGKDHIGVQFCYLSRESQTQIKKIITYLRQMGAFQGNESIQELETALPFLF